MTQKRNFSAKREAIYNALVSTKLHPSVEWIYHKLKPTIPNLSLGTVYRNLNVLREMELVKSVGVVNGQERFDADMSQHPHFICTKCFRVIDVPVGKNFFEANAYEYISDEYDVEIQSHSLTFYGICRSCPK